MWFSSVEAKSNVQAAHAQASKKRSPSAETMSTSSDSSAEDVYELANSPKRARHQSPEPKVSRSPSPLFGSDCSSPQNTTPVASPQVFGPEPRPLIPHAPARLHALWDEACRTFDARTAELLQADREALNAEARRLNDAIRASGALDTFEHADDNSEFFPNAWVIVSPQMSDALNLVGEHGDAIDEAVREALVATLWSSSWERLGTYLEQIYTFNDPILAPTDIKRNYCDTLGSLQSLYPWVRSYARGVTSADALERVAQRPCQIAALHGDKEFVASVMNFVDSCIAEDIDSLAAVVPAAG